MTFFSSQEFIGLVTRVFPDQYRPLAIWVESSGAARTMYACETFRHYPLRHISLGPFGAYASPGWDDRLEPATVVEIVRSLKGVRTTAIYWNVRFDHEDLAAGLASLGFRRKRTSTHVLPLEADPEKVFQEHNATIRNQVRKAKRLGVVVRDARDVEDVAAYYKVHTRLVEQSGGYGFVYPIEFFLESLKIAPLARLLLAECNGRVAAGGLFFHDGCSVMYWHSAADRDYSHYFPMCAVLDEAIRWGCEIGAAFFNFGNSGGIRSLEAFKSFWGARVEFNRHYTWRNPFWGKLSRLRGAVRGEAG